MNESGKYLYGILNSGQAQAQKIDLANLEALGDGKLALVTYKDISALVSDWDKETVDLAEKNLQAHNNVLEALMKVTAVLPFEFGIVSPSLKDVERMLKLNYSAIVKSIQSLRDKGEIDLKACWRDMKKIFESIVNENPSIARFKKEIASRPYEATYKERIVIGQMVAEALADKKERVASKILAVLKKHAVKLRGHHLLEDNTIFNICFLLQKEKIKLFDETLGQLAKSYENIDFKYTGPLPPLGFVDLRLKV